MDHGRRMARERRVDGNGRLRAALLDQGCREIGNARADRQALALATRTGIQMQRFVAFMDEFRDFEQDEFEEAKQHFVATFRKSPREDFHAFIGDWAHLLATKAARQLYKKLIIGKIDLTKRNLPDNSKLTIYVLWYEKPGKPAQKLPVASFI
jgi:hypothetical protein